MVSLCLLLAVASSQVDVENARLRLLELLDLVRTLPVRPECVEAAVPRYSVNTGGAVNRFFSFPPYTVTISAMTGKIAELNVNEYPRPDGFDRATAEPVPEEDLRTIALRLAQDCVQPPERLEVRRYLVGGARLDDVTVDLRRVIGNYEVFSMFSTLEVTLDRYSGYPVNLVLGGPRDYARDPRFSTPRHGRAIYQERGLASLASLGAFSEGRLERSDLFWWRPATGSECIHEVPPELFQLGAENKLILCHALYVLGRAVEAPGRRIGAHILVDATTAKTLAIVIEPRTDLGPNEAGRDPVLDPKGRLVTPLGRLARALVPAPAEAKRDFPVAASWIGRNGDLVSVTLDATGRFLRHRDATYRLDRPVPKRDLAAPAVPKFGGGSPAARGLPALGVQAG